MMNIPKTKTITLSQSQRFIEGLKQLASECGVEGVSYNAFGPGKFYFADGSSIGSTRAFIDAGYIDENTFRNKYLKALENKHEI